MSSRAKKAKWNIIISLLAQAVALVCGFIAPRLLLRKFGSEAYGATTSIASFLAYITLLEGGIGGVARAALYKPLSNRNPVDTGAIFYEIKRFFRIVACVFALYVLILAVSYKSISGLQYFDWISSAVLVVVISFSTFAQYFFGISNTILIQADQKQYLIQALNITTTVLNTVMVVIMVRLNVSLILIKLFSSCVFFIKPLFLYLYVKRKYVLVKPESKKSNLLSQKWTGLGQHIAYFFHSNTDVVVLTLLADLKTVAVYSVYHMVITHLKNIASSFAQGMEALFGNMIAKEEHDNLQKAFGFYETLISFVCIVLFSTTAVMILPFVSLYTAKITDTNYYHPAFAFVLILAEVLTCLRQPYHSAIIAAGHFKQTRMAAYGETLLNISISVILVLRFSLVGVAIGTAVSVGFRFLYYAIYLSKYILKRNILLFVKRMCVNSASFAVAIFAGMQILSRMTISNYMEWILAAIPAGIVSLAVAVLSVFLFYRSDLIPIFKKLIPKKRKAG